MTPRHILLKLTMALVSTGLLALLLVILMAGSNATSAPALAVPKVPVSATATPSLVVPELTASATATPTLSGKFAEGERRLAADLTEIALTPRPTYIPILPTIAPVQWWPPSVPYTATGAGYLLTGMNPPGSSADFKMEDTWIELLSDHRIDVYSGAQGYAGDPQQGELIIFTRRLTGELLRSVEVYLTPTRVGPVRVVDAVGARLTLQAPDTTQLYFDVDTRQWGSP